MISDISWESGCTTIQQAGTRNTIVACPGETVRTTEVGSGTVSEDNGSSFKKFTLFQQTTDRGVPGLPIGYEDLYVEVQERNGSYVTIPVVSNAYLGSVTVDGLNVSWQTKKWVYTKLPGINGGTIEVPVADNPRPDTTRFLSRDQIIVEVQKALQAAAKK